MDGKKYNNIDAIQFDATGTSDQDGDIMTYKWIDESDGNKVLSTRMKFSTTMTKLGTHTITLEVSDGKETGTTSIGITVAEPTNKLPSISISDPVRGSTVKGTVIIDGRASDDDGTVAEVCIKIDGGACQKATGKTDWSYEWNTASVEGGLHTIKAQVTDDRGDTSDVSITVTVQGKSKAGQGFLGLPGFEAPLMLAAGALVALAVAARKRWDE
jgi:PKD repeat protein